MPSSFYDPMRDMESAMRHRLDQMQRHYEEKLREMVSHQMMPQYVGIDPGYNNDAPKEKKPVAPKFDKKLLLTTKG